MSSQKLNSIIPHDAATARFYCELCKVLRIDSDDIPIVYCCHCDCPLCPMYDYACIGCGRFFCDNDCQVCQEGGCDVITCVDCVSRHIANSHPPEAVA